MLERMTGVLLLAVALVACAHSEPPPQSEPPPPGSPHRFNLNPIVHPRPELPNELRANHQGQNLAVAYVLSIGVDGHVHAVRSLTKMPDVDAAVIPVLQTWTYPPPALPIQTVVSFEFAIPLGHPR